MDKFSQILIWNRMAQLGLTYDDYYMETTSPEYIQLLRKDVTDFLTANACNENGTTILHEACKRHNLLAVQHLFENGARINDYNEFGVTPLVTAFRVVFEPNDSKEIIFDDFKETVDFLIKSGAKAKSKDFAFNKTNNSFSTLNDVCRNMLINLATNNFCFYERTVDNQGHQQIVTMDNYKVRVLDYLYSLPQMQNKFKPTFDDLRTVKKSGDVQLLEKSIENSPDKFNLLQSLHREEAKTINNYIMAIIKLRIQELNYSEIIQESPDCSQITAFYSYLAKKNEEKVCKNLRKTIKNHTMISKYDNEQTFSVPEYPFYFARFGYNEKGEKCIEDAKYWPSEQEFVFLMIRYEKELNSNSDDYPTVQTFDRRTSQNNNDKER